MNTLHRHEHNSLGNWLAFIFGALFNLAAETDFRFLVDYTLQAIIGGSICLLFKLLGDFITTRLKKRNKSNE